MMMDGGVNERKAGWMNDGWMRGRLDGWMQGRCFQQGVLMKSVGWWTGMERRNCVVAAVREMCVACNFFPNRSVNELIHQLNSM